MANRLNLSTQIGWVSGLISGLGASITPNTLGAVTAWTNAEGVWGRTGGSVVNNPLGITLSYGVPTTGILPGNTDGVLAFATPAQGLQATIAFIKNRTPGIASALQANATAPQLYSTVNSTGWAGSGGYPTPWTGGVPSRSRLPGGSTANAGSSVFTRPGGKAAGSSDSQIDQLLSDYTSQPDNVQTTGIPILSDIPNPFTFVGNLISGIGDVASFLKYLAWVLNPANILRMVEVLLGIGMMAFGIQSAVQGRSEAAEGFQTGEAAISRSGLGRVAREVAAAAMPGGTRRIAKPAAAPHAVRRTALRTRYEREKNVANRKTAERRKATAGNSEPKTSLG